MNQFRERIAKKYPDYYERSSADQEAHLTLVTNPETLCNIDLEYVDTLRAVIYTYDLSDSCVVFTGILPAKECIHLNGLAIPYGWYWVKWVDDLPVRFYRRPA